MAEMTKVRAAIELIRSECDGTAWVRLADALEELDSRQKPDAPMAYTVSNGSGEPTQAVATFPASNPAGGKSRGQIVAEETVSAEGTHVRLEHPYLKRAMLLQTAFHDSITHLRQYIADAIDRERASATKEADAANYERGRKDQRAGDVNRLCTRIDDGAGTWLERQPL